MRELLSMCIMIYYLRHLISGQLYWLPMKYLPAYAVPYGRYVRNTVRTGPGPGPTGPGPGSHPARVPGPTRGPTITLGPRIRLGRILMCPIGIIINNILIIIIIINIPYYLFFCMPSFESKSPRWAAGSLAQPHHVQSSSWYPWQ